MAGDLADVDVHVPVARAEDAAAGVGPIAAADRAGDRRAGGADVDVARRIRDEGFDAVGVLAGDRHARRGVDVDRA